METQEITNKYKEVKLNLTTIKNKSYNDIDEFLDKINLGNSYKLRFRRYFEIIKSSFTTVNSGFIISKSLELIVFRSPLKKTTIKKI